MWLIPTKKEVKKEFEKISNAFKDRDATIKELREKIDANALKVATLEGFILNKSQVSVSPSLKQSQETFETKLIQRIRKNKKALVIAEIMKLGASTSAIEMFNIIVKERGLCSKASFYRYLDSLKSQKFETNETDKETIETKARNKAR